MAKTTHYSVIIMFIVTSSGFPSHWRFSLSGGQNNSLLGCHCVHIYVFRHFVPLEEFSSLVLQIIDYSVITAFIFTSSSPSHQRFSFYGAPNNRLLGYHWVHTYVFRHFVASKVFSPWCPKQQITRLSLRSNLRLQALSYILIFLSPSQTMAFNWEWKKEVMYNLYIIQGKPIEEVIEYFLHAAHTFSCCGC